MAAHVPAEDTYLPTGQLRDTCPESLYWEGEVGCNEPHLHTLAPMCMSSFPCYHHGVGDDAESCGSTSPVRSFGENREQINLEYQLLTVARRLESFDDCLYSCEAACNESDDAVPYSIDVSVAMPGAGVRPDAAPSERSTGCRVTGASMPGSSLTFFYNFAVLALTSSGLLLASRLGNASKPFRMVALALEVLVLHAVLPTISTWLGRIQRHTKASGHMGLVAAVSLSPVLKPEYSEDMASYRRFQTAEHKMWFLKALIMGSLSAVQVLREVTLLSGMCLVRYVPFTVEPIAQLLFASWGQFSHSWSSGLNLAGCLWLPAVRLATQVFGISESCQTLCQSGFEEGLELPFSGVPTLMQLVYFTVVTTFIWGFMLALLQTDVKGSALSLTIMYAGHVLPRVANLSCQGVELDMYDDGWAMFEAHCLSFAIAFSIIFAGRVYLEEKKLDRFIMLALTAKENIDHP